MASLRIISRGLGATIAKTGSTVVLDAQGYSRNLDVETSDGGGVNDTRDSPNQTTTLPGGLNIFFHSLRYCCWYSSTNICKEPRSHFRFLSSALFCKLQVIAVFFSQNYSVPGSFNFLVKRVKPSS
ncbi:hypothetical protein L2E82_36375 [Cichorium intybus]|uniref:Uncharacterized protein n=1 Tax=Cichorium intybus TaxID=13427 RepID=A0ACB9BRC0_CICIN|nr:hypothetical protein L2E82_36375 [Cichorium intybus]